jgi:hypothetical protein
MTAATDVLPRDSDLPGSGWMAIDEGFGAGPGEGGPGELIDCVGPDFPGDDEILETAGTPHYVRPPGRLLHGLGVLTGSDRSAHRAEVVLSGRAFAECLGRSVALDLSDPDIEAELVDVDVQVAPFGHRVRFTGSSAAGVRPVLLDVVCLRAGRAVGLLWFADSPEPFPAPDVAAVVERIRGR